MKFTSAQEIRIHAVWPASISPVPSPMVYVYGWLGVSVGRGSAGAACRCNAGACNSVLHSVRDGLKRAPERTAPRPSTCRRSVRRGLASARPRRLRRLRRAFRIDARLHAVATLGQLPSCDASDGAVRGTPLGRKARHSVRGAARNPLGIPAKVLCRLSWAAPAAPKPDSRTV